MGMRSRRNLLVDFSVIFYFILLLMMYSQHFNPKAPVNATSILQPLPLFQTCTATASPEFVSLHLRLTSQVDQRSHNLLKRSISLCISLIQSDVSSFVSRPNRVSSFRIKFDKHYVNRAKSRVVLCPVVNGYKSLGKENAIPRKEGYLLEVSN